MESIKLISRFMVGLQGLLMLAHGYADPLIARYAWLTTSMARTEPPRLLESGEAKQSYRSTRWDLRRSCAQGV
ncbi:hypothetical protein BN2475_140031 [Paraburkholderia ribeironis]|uniref:Uncharacterized protein n=1 Tax=Paraburkholderia ribeironis TaxID=1247936 RepID=A0A1N7RSR3_9BURK|nr:hypothetical protein BN2475_140031 [Paraburkholderia ribeironis]